MSAIFAVFNHPENGYPSEGPAAIKSGLVVGQKYRLSSASVSGSSSSVWLNGFRGRFNSVLFDFKFENGKPADIYGMPEYSDYL